MTRRTRQLSEEERELFERALSDAVPLGRAPRRAKKRKAAAAPQPSAPAQTKLPQPELLQPKLTVQRSPRKQLSGIDGNTAERLRRGLFEPQARLDLHGLTERAAHRALVTFIRGAKARKLRLVLVVTGKGDAARATDSGGVAFDLGLDMRLRGVLRVMTPRRLNEPGLAEHIADLREAHNRHGGAGALYVYLRKE
jgi:DNA-nicking Smr family endonuclease